MWRIVHQFGSPPWVYRFCDRVIPWLLPLTVVALLVGSAWGLLFAPTDYKQGDSYRIIYIHVPASVVALAGYYVMASAGLVSLVWRVKLADTAMRAAAPIGAAYTAIALVTGAIWGKPTWGAWWVWDARITSMLILFFLYVGVMALFEAYENKTIAARACAILSLVGTVNRLYNEGHTIKLFTARGSMSGKDWTEHTAAQMKEWGIKYHELIMNKKPHYDLLVDDKAVNVEDWMRSHGMKGS